MTCFSKPSSTSPVVSIPRYVLSTAWAATRCFLIAPRPPIARCSGCGPANYDRITRHWAEMGYVVIAPTHIDGLFFRALIIGLCDPHHQRPGDILAWHRWIGGHTDTLKLSVLSQGAFSIPIDTSGDLAPLTGARRGHR